MSDKSSRPPPPAPQRKHTPVGESKLPRRTKAEGAKMGPEATTPHRARKRSGAMHATTRPDNPLAVFKAKEKLSQAAPPAAPDVPARTATAPQVPTATAPQVPTATTPQAPTATAPQAPTAAQAPSAPLSARRVSPPPRVPPPAPRVPPSVAVSSQSLPVVAPPPPPPPPRGEASVPPAAHTSLAPGHEPPKAPEPQRERLDITISAVPHPRLSLPVPSVASEPEPEDATPPPMVTRAPAPHRQELPEAVATLPNQLPAPSRKRHALVFAGAAVVVVGALALSSWLAPQIADRTPQPLPAPAPARAAASPAAIAPHAVGKRPAAPAPAAPPAAPAHVASAAEASSRVGDSSIPWLEGGVTTDCVPAALPEGAPSLQDQAKSQQEYAKGRRLLVQGKLAPSLSAFCEAARLNPLHSTLAFEVARAALISRDAVTASRFAERSLALTPPDRRSRELLADALAWQGDVEAARAAWLAIHKLPTANEKTLANLALGAVLEARTTAKQGDYATTERYLRRALAFGPENATTTTELARVLLLAGHHQAAERWIQRALSLDASDPERQVLAGDIRDKLGDRTAADSHYSRALELEPRHAVAKLRIRAYRP